MGLSSSAPLWDFSMANLTTTPMEHAVLECLYRIYYKQGFPSPDSFAVRNRQNTGGGRYVELVSNVAAKLKDGYIDLAGQFIEMRNLPSGMMAVALIKNGYVTALEFTVYGGDEWDGNESGWKIV